MAKAANERLAAWRKRLGLSLAGAGERLGISWQSERRYESGERTPPVETLARIRDVAGIPIEAWIPPKRRR